MVTGEIGLLPFESTSRVHECPIKFICQYMRRQITTPVKFPNNIMKRFSQNCFFVVRGKTHKKSKLILYAVLTEKSMVHFPPFPDNSVY